MFFGNSGEIGRLTHRIGVIERKLDLVLEHLGIENPDDELEAQVRALLGAGRKIEAIKLYRARTGADLKSAKDAVEGMGP